MLTDNFATLDCGALLPVTEFAGASQRRKSAREEKQETQFFSVFEHHRDDGAWCCDESVLVVSGARVVSCGDESLVLLTPHPMDRDFVA